MNIRWFASAAILGAAMFGAPSLLQAQNAARSIWDGVYTAAQADRGKAQYLQNCARCHVQSLDGSDEVPPLQGAHFTANWDGQTVADLVHRIYTTMPMDNPGHLSIATATDLVAFLLASNQIPAGSAELTSNPPGQSQIRIDTSKPAK